MATTLKAEMWDRMQFLFRNYYDRMVHAKLTYEGSFDMEVLKNVVLFMVEKAPVLHSSFNTTVIEPYWKEENYTIDDIVSYEKVEDADKVADEWLLGVIPYDNNVQIKIAVFEDDKHSVLALRICAWTAATSNTSLRRFVKTIRILKPETIPRFI